MGSQRSQFIRNALITGASILAATLLRSWIAQRLHEPINYGTFYLAVVVSSLYCGLAWGVASTALSALAAAVVLPPFGKFVVEDLNDLAGMLLFLTVCGVIVWLCDRVRNAQQVAEVAAEERQRLLTREKEARAEAERLNHAKDDFLAAVSHELRTPLQSILGWSELLREGPADPDDVKLATASIERSVRMQTQLINDLLDLSRIVMGKLRLEPRPTSLDDVVQAAVETVLPAAAAKQVRIEVESDGVGAVLGDPDRLQQVVWNLLTNAIKFTSSGGVITAQVWQRGEYVEVKVSDNGDGISPDLLPSIFNRFEQGEARRGEGLGLGLSIAKELVELHGGTITASSRGKGQGAEFCARFPKHRPSAVAVDCGHDATSAVDWRRGGLAGKQVLVVDDDVDARRVLKAVLNQCGADVLTAETAEQASDLLRAYDPDAVTCDLDMPGLNGYEFVERLRTSKRHAESPPVIALTACASDADRRRTTESGFQGHLVKPVRPQELATTIAGVARRPKPR
jgi:signal transduction histidine kinase